MSPCVQVVGLEVDLSFDNATLIASNLGGKGGPNDPTSISTPHLIHYGGVGAMPDGTRIDLTVSNATEYHAYNSNNNGLAVKANGTLGAINLLGRHVIPAFKDDEDGVNPTCA